MSLDEQLQNDMKTAMRAKDSVRLGAIRMLRSTLQAETNTKRQRQLDALVAERGVRLDEIEPNDLPPSEPLSETEMRNVIKREVKKRQDSLDAYAQAGRTELAAQEHAEIEVLKSYLPQQKSAAELRPEVKAIIDEVGATSKADMRKVMPVVMTRLGEQADGRTLSQLVGELLGQ